MLRRRVLVSGSLGLASAASCPYASIRSITARGQFNPIHDFSVSLGKYADSAASSAPLSYAKNEKEFETLIRNPGPIRVGYSPDYLNWLYLAYKNKVAFELEQQQKLKTSSTKLSGSDEKATTEKDTPEMTGRFLRPEQSLRRRAGEATKAACQAKINEVVREQGYYDLIERQPQFPVMDLTHATRFHVVELFKDLVLNYYNSNYFNLGSAGGSGDGNSAADENSFSFAQEVWDKALMYRAILEERRNAYPEKMFKMVFEAVKDTNLAPLEVDKSSSINSSSDVSVSSSSSSAAGGGALADCCPSEDHYLYLRYLVKKYYVENAVEAHVVLKSHRQPNAPELLFSMPPPKDDQEVFASLLSGNSSGSNSSNTSEGKAKADEGTASPAGGVEQVKRVIARKPGAYPPIEALWRCEENLPLLKILVFGELNLFVSENPFIKFPNAQSFLTRPYANASSPAPTGGGGNRNTNARRNRQHQQSDVLSLANIIAERRGSTLASIPRNVANVVDARGADARRQQQRFHREDILAFSKVLTQHRSGKSAVTAAAGGKSASGPTAAATATTTATANAMGAGSEDSDTFFYGAYSDYNYYNPRTTRAEKRDNLTRNAIAALKTMRAAADAVYRDTGVEELEANQQFVRSTDGRSALPVPMPTVPHFAALVRKDPHVSYLLHTGSGEAGLVVSEAATASTTTADDAASGSLRQANTVAELERLIHQYARTLHNTALQYHQETVRRVNRQKVNVAAVLLDRYVAQVLARTEKQLALLSSSPSSPLSSSFPLSKEGGTAATATTTTTTTTGLLFGNDAVRLFESLGSYKPFENRALDESGYFTDARMDDYRRWMAAP